ncbi:phosphotransferase enzyme family protein-like protein [Mollisia scopiformis]|uniref:Phosphotransferase enzyme family protein-like protein n=1 Tax=Mollisia scopiformis TaxID=149040 RepID=A0A194X2T3_MOLSC|nr:phosphotransferase enzyme family protein-like protein [Mollisia scopiformis]KUJ14488.1 phosphotransferase enzyme family protein-like protein [Mollisia scopiformis]
MLPPSEDIYFRNTAFFASGNSSLPTPADVRRAAGPKATSNRPTPVAFSALNLIVKYGPTITITEGQCLWAIKHLLPSVPVPEVYGWCREQGETFIYMQLVEGVTLEQAWPDFDIEHKYEICLQLQRILDDVRQLKQDPTSPFIGDINQEPLHDVMFQTNQPAGPFSNVPAFNDWLATLRCRAPPGVDVDTGPWRSGLLDDIPIVFTHADLYRSNIMVCQDANGIPRITAIIDWHQSGWYPASWEFYKTRLTCKLPANDQWELEFVVEFLQSYRGYIAWEYLLQGVGL